MIFLLDKHYVKLDCQKFKSVLFVDRWKTSGGLFLCDLVRIFSGCRNWLIYIYSYYQMKKGLYKNE